MLNPIDNSTKPGPIGQNANGPNTSSNQTTNNNLQELLKNPKIPGALAAAETPRSNLFSHLEDDFIPPQGPGIDRARRLAKGGAGLIEKAISSIKGLSRGIFQQVNSMFQTLIRNPSALAWGSGIGALIAGVLAAKNAFHGLNIALGRRTDEKLSSLPYLFQGVLQGGLTAALLSTVLGGRNPLMEKVGNTLAVSKKIMVGGVVAPLLMGLWIKLAEGSTALTRIPIIGPMLNEVAATPLQWLKDAFKGKNDEIPSAMGAGAKAPATA